MRKENTFMATPRKRHKTICISLALMLLAAMYIIALPQPVLASSTTLNSDYTEATRCADSNGNWYTGSYEYWKRDLTPYQRTAVECNTNSIPDGSTINSITLHYKVGVASGSGNFNISAYNSSTKPSAESSASNLYAACSGGTVYATRAGGLSEYGGVEVSLGTNACTDMENNLTSDWFAVGFAQLETSSAKNAMNAWNSITDDYPYWVISFTSPYTLADALDNTLTWTTGVDAEWYGQSTTTHDFIDAAQSGTIGNLETSYLQTTVSGPGTLTFWWKVSSEEDYDYLSFYIDGVLQEGQISGWNPAPAWAQKTYSISTGSHTLKWEYKKDPYTEEGSDCGWVDQVTYTPAPTVTTSAASLVSTTSATLGGNVTDDGGAVVTERGVVYSSTDETPTIGEGGVTKDTNGSRTGSFSESIGSLSPGITYYFQAYAINSAGTAYGGVQNFTTTYPEINLKQGMTDIADGGSYDYGTKSAGSNTDVTFTIENTGTADLTLSGTPIITITGTNADQFSVQSQPSSPVSALGSTTFTIRFSPTTGGAKTAEIAIVNDDPNKNPYNLTLNGTGSASVTFTNGANASLNYQQTSPSPPQDNWHFGQFSIAGDATGATLNSVTVTLGGDYDSGDLGSDPDPFRLYANDSNNFGTATAIGSDVAASGSDVTFSSLNNAIPSGTRYYWVTADISGTANINGTIDALGDLNISNGTISGSSNYGKLNASSDASLPVFMQQLSATLTESGILISWITESEIDNLGFILERRQSDEEDWHVIASYRTSNALSGQGNTSTKTEYEFLDQNVENGITYWYRLSDVDMGGNVTVDGIITVNSNNNELFQTTDLKPVVPNPFNPMASIQYNLSEETTVSLVIYNILGRKVRTLVSNQLQPLGSYRLYWNAKSDEGKNLPSGAYILILKTASYIKSQKMILLR